MMIDDEEKSRRELNIFGDFVKCSGLSIDPNSVEKRNPPEPDILCEIGKEGLVAFELMESCDDSLAEKISYQLKLNNPEPVFLRLGNTGDSTLKNKRSKQYLTDYPIELLCYTDGRNVSPPDVIISRIRSCFDYKRGPFRRIWFMGEPNETCECIID